MNPDAVNRYRKRAMEQAIPQPQPIVVAKQIVYQNTFIDVIPAPDGNIIMQITSPGSGEMLIFPMSAEAAKEIGGKLSAPHIVPARSGPPMNGHAHG